MLKLMPTFRAGGMEEEEEGGMGRSPETMASQGLSQELALSRGLVPAGSPRSKVTRRWHLRCQHSAKPSGSRRPAWGRGGGQARGTLLVGPQGHGGVQGHQAGTQRLPQTR